ncbi:vomeronasal type-1 receptor 4-like [Equus przewalskii]|uniref:Vomeronasal type-1 receptor n=1 Tax=Equus przewalskii TaxID=9798 RepID=A0ABM2EWP9_EQUPR|nr:vomeronasal 1 receptor equCabV1R929 [Equus caballus]XP_008523339.1 PREDICTED: vomeronasal type-1 receptor 4-like [Equus przewalskii]
MIHVDRDSYPLAGFSSSEDKYLSLTTDRKASRELVVGIILSLQTTFGILGNFSLLYHYLFLYFTGSRLRSTDLIVKNLIVANLLVLLFSGIPHTMSSFGWYQVYSDFGCRFFLYFRGVGRGVSISTTCLLSVFQAIMICPRKSGRADLKEKALKCVVPSISLCWVLHMLVNVLYPMFVSSNWGNKNITNQKSFGYCSAVRHDKTRDSLYAALLSVPDVFSLVLMMWASGSMVFILYRHKQRVKHLHRTNVSSRSSPESRATKTILLLVSTFVYFYTLSSICYVCLALFHNPNWFILKISSIISLCFPTASPFLFMSCDSSLFRLCFAWIRNTKFLNLLRNL